MLNGLNLVNLTPHPIVIDDGTTVLTIDPSGTIARVATTLTDLGDGLFTRTWGDVVDLPAPQDNTILIVSAMVAGRVPNRTDVASPATDLAKRDDNGRIVSVPGLIVNR